MLTPRTFARQTLPVAATAIYQVPKGARARIDAFAVANFSAAPATFTLWLVKAAGAADNTAVLVQARSVAAGGSARVLEALGQWLESEGAIYALASTATAITAHVSGVEQTGS